MVDYEKYMTDEEICDFFRQVLEENEQKALKTTRRRTIELERNMKELLKENMFQNVSEKKKKLRKKRNKRVQSKGKCRRSRGRENKKV